MTIKFGIGIDVHAFTSGRELILGGVTIEHPYGLAGHSDADVLIHAIIDALLGACGAGDIGRHFPDTSDDYKGISSRELLRRTCGIIAGLNHQIVNIDATLICEKPKIAPYAERMIASLKEIVGTEIQINIKGKSSEHLGFTGRGEGICALAIAGCEERSNA